jgi:type IV pilus assembly protein PilM
MRNPFKKLLPKKFLGVDIGTSSIKLVEISKFGYRKKLENYGQVESSIFYDKPFRTQEKTSLLLSNQEISKAILAIVEEAKIKTKNAVFSIPDFSSFFTNFTLPPMTKDELPQSIKYEAKQHIPVPLTEVVLDWQIIETKPVDKQQAIFKVLLAAVPNEIINQYQEIAKTAGLELLALEAEVFSLIRALANNHDKKLIGVIDIGVQSTTCSIVDQGALKISHSFDISDNNFVSTISNAMNIDMKKAEELKKQYGISHDNQEIKQILSPLIDIIVREVKEIFDNFQRQEKKQVEKIILAGGPALIPGLKEYFKESFNGKEVEIGNPFNGMLYPPNLEQILIEIGPSFAIAVGAALRKL